jgi:hypothetical protein
MLSLALSTQIHRHVRFIAIAAACCLGLVNTAAAQTTSSPSQLPAPSTTTIDPALNDILH